MIEVKNLSKYYGDFKAVDKLNFRIGEGEIVGFLGPNGAGKSTTMNMLTGYLAASEGQILIDNKDIMEDAKTARKAIGYLPEIPPLYPDMTVMEYLSFIYELKGAKQPRKEHLQEICKLAGIEEVRGRLIGNLSKGYRQRVGIAYALVGDPPILILDEPTAGLDPKQIAEIRELVVHLGKKHTVMLSTHILSEVPGGVPAYHRYQRRKDCSRRKSGYHCGTIVQGARCARTDRRAAGRGGYSA